MSGIGLLVSCYFLALASALFPWVNGEVLMLSLSAITRSPVHLAGLVLLASAGQMTGKSILYWAGYGALPMKKGRIANVVNFWRARVERSSKKAMGLLFVSAICGIPPFYIMSILSGTLRLPFSRFLAIGACGRLLHFGVIMLIPQFGRHFIRAIVHP
jgi:membrane protein YqaA with SNARE-associated domain